MLRYRSYLYEELSAQQRYSHRGLITDWRYPINGVEAGQLLRDGKAKLVKANGGRVFLAVEGDKEYRVKAGLAKGVKTRYWR